MKRIGNYVQELIRANVQGKKAVTNNAMRFDKKKALFRFWLVLKDKLLNVYRLLCYIKLQLKTLLFIYLYS